MPPVFPDLNAGYWRGDISRTNVLECLNPSACIGGRGMDVSSSSSSSSNFNSASGGDHSVLVSATATVGVQYDESRYCVEGHKGAYCSVCADGYRRFSGQQLCISCAGGWSNGARGMLWVLGIASPLLLIVFVVFLIGGVPAVSQASYSMFSCCAYATLKMT